ncbi:MAG: hypothetical protein QOH31_4131 [Verrucomicrobiota bacterium]
MDVAALMNLALMPREAIIESWNLLQNLLFKVAKRKGHDFVSLPATVPYALGAALGLHSMNLIPDSILTAIQHLMAVYKRVIDNACFNRPRPRQSCPLSRLKASRLGVPIARGPKTFV